MEVKKTVQLTATVAPAGTTNKKVTRASKNAEFATVDAATGLVTGVAEGLQQLKSPTADGSRQSNLAVQVTAAAAAVIQQQGDSGHPVQGKTHETSKIHLLEPQFLGYLGICAAFTLKTAFPCRAAILKSTADLRLNACRND
ncbi:Ig-like domain-containing protein [Klebsiella pneumoniae]|nr:Ig-like domain-containing protein [Klebsiella pneumoniae]